jgi:hypothetical protein
MPAKSNERVSQETFLKRKKALKRTPYIGWEVQSQKNKQWIPATGGNIKRVYDILHAEEEEKREYASHRFLASLVRDTRKANKKPKKIFSYDLNIDKKNTGYGQLENILEKFNGKNINVKWDFINRNYNNFNLNEWKDNEGETDFMHNSDLSIFQWYWMDTSKTLPPLIIEILDRVAPVNTSQRFAEGITHCVFEPIKEWALEQFKNTKSKASYVIFRRMLKNIERFTREFKNGLPEDKIQMVCDKLRIDISITLPLLGNTEFINVKSAIKRYKLFKFLNTKLNHVDKLVRTDNITNVEDLQNMLSIKDKLDINKEFYTYRKNKYIHTIHTLKTTYKIDNDFTTLINEFENKYNIHSFKIDDITQPLLAKFIKSSKHYNGTIDINNGKIDINYDNLSLGGGTNTRNGLKINLADMEKAYKQYKLSKYYEGFLSKITDYRQVDNGDNYEVIENIGLYRIINISFKKCLPSFTKIIEKLKCYLDGNTYPSPELRFLLDNNVSFKIIEGCWGFSKYIDFPEEFDEQGADGVRRYAKYVGMCDMHNLTSAHWVQGDKKMIEHIKSYTTANMYSTSTTAVIEYDKQHNYTFAHFTSFITMYQRLNMIEQLLEIPYEHIIRICVDGIYHTASNIELKNAFRVKYDINFNNHTAESYISHLNEPYTITENKYIKPSVGNVEFHLGAGGTGKTHKALKDEGNINMIYIAPTHKLAANKKEEFGIPSTVLAIAIGQNPERKGEIKRKYNVLLFDEVSMYSTETVNKIIEEYYGFKIIFCGDIGYQLPPIKARPVDLKSVDGDFEVIEYTKNYRITCNKLLKLAENMRLDIKNNAYPKLNRMRVMNYFKENLPNHIINKDELQKIYTIDDMILSSTNKNKDEFTNMFKNKFEKEKYYVRKKKNGYYNGSIVIEDREFEKQFGIYKEKIKKDGTKNKPNCEIQHAFTIHCIQGETAQHKLFIDMRDISTIPMLYTAISRAKTLDQIYLIDIK